MLHELVTPILAKAMNAYIGLDPDTAVKLKALAGQTVRLEITGLPLNLNFNIDLLFNSTGIEILQNYQGVVNTTLRGTPLALMKLGLGPTSASSFFNSEVSISGDLELGQTVKNILDHMEIDWEEHLSHFIGDVPAHQLGNAARAAQQFGQQASESLRKSLSEYLHEEKRLVVTQAELTDFFDDVSQVRNDVERLAARVELLKQGV